MMPGFGFEEIFLLVVVAIIVIGPQDLPLMMRKFGRFTGKMRALAFEFQQGIDELGRQAELEELRKEVDELKKHTGLEDLKRDLDQAQADLETDAANVMRPTDPAALPKPAGEGPAGEGAKGERPEGEGEATPAEGAEAEAAGAASVAAALPSVSGGIDPALLDVYNERVMSGIADAPAAQHFDDSVPAKQDAPV